MRAVTLINRPIALSTARQNSGAWLLLTLLLLFALVLQGCGIAKTQLEPKFTYHVQKRDIRCLSSSFPPLSPYEQTTDWGKELHIADGFARNLDFYRAITTYHRALFLLPPDEGERQRQIEYDIILCYYLAHRYNEAIQAFEGSSLREWQGFFPATDNLLLLLYDSYREVGFCDRAETILAAIHTYSPGMATDLTLFAALHVGEYRLAEAYMEGNPSALAITRLVDCYTTNAKSPRRARQLNALLPGAGYYYIGQKKTALTSFLLNAAFIAAAYQFFTHKYWAAGAITTSFEFGWYVGGINGAGLEAQEYNNRLYERNACGLLTQERLFPVLQFQKIF